MLTKNLFRSLNWDPVRGLAEFDTELDRMFGGLHGKSWHRTFPALNVWLGKEDVRVVAEIPGVDPNALDLTVEANVLTIRGKLGTDENHEGLTSLRRERPYGEFTRSIELPVLVDAENVTAAYKHGVLTVTLPRAKEALPRKIKVS